MCSLPKSTALGFCLVIGRLTLINSGHQHEQGQQRNNHLMAHSLSKSTQNHYFRKHKILALENLYTYHCYLETYKVMKFRAPMVMFSGYNTSKRKPTLMIQPIGNVENHNTRSTKLWNTITPKLKVSDFTMSIECLRQKLKESLLVIQHKNSDLNWTSEDFNTTNLTFEKLKC